MPKTTTKKKAQTAATNNGRPATKTPRPASRKRVGAARKKPTLEELTLRSFQLAYDSHQQQQARLGQMTPQTKELTIRAFQMAYESHRRNPA